MMRLLVVASCAVLGAAPPVRTQTPAARDQTVLRIAVDLVQIDATVTDRRGRHVADLSAADFEIFQDGRPQKISTFAYIDAAPSATDSAATPRLGPTRALQTDEVRRTIALVVDDLGLSFESIYRVQGVLKRFVDTQMQPGDLVAILRTGAGMGALQQFTSDRRMLHGAIEGIRWNMLTRVSPFQAIREEDRTLEELREEHFSAGTLGAIDYVVRGIGELPGRKSLIVLSDGFRITDASFGSGSQPRYGRVFDALRRLVDSANRAGVVIYTIDMRGLAATGMSAADPGELDPENPGAVEASRREELRETQDGLGFLAHETGGLFMRNNNDISGGVQRAVDDQRGYYLLGYVPDAGTFGQARPKFHSLRVNMKRPGLVVRSRRGFYGVPDKMRPPQTPENRMVSAVTSPFAGDRIRLRLSSFFSFEKKTGAVMFSVMHIDARDLSFTTQPNGERFGELETLAVTFGENGQIAEQAARKHTFTIKPDAYERALERGFVYRTVVPLKRPGPYQLRIALRDVASDRIGSASQFIEVPDLKKGRLALSGLALEGATAAMIAGTPPQTGVDERDPGATLALRKFRQGTAASYVAFIYNAKTGSGGRWRLEASTRLYRDGREVFRSEPRAVTPIQGAPGPVATGVLAFGAEMPPGSYVLEIEVIDLLAKKHSRATQTIDFDVIP